MENHIIYEIDEKDLELGFNIVKNRDIDIKIEEQFFRIYKQEQLIYRLPINDFTPKKYTITFIFFNNTRILLVNNYQVLQDNYVHFKTNDLETTLEINSFKFNHKEWKKQESDYEYVMLLAEEDDNVKNTLSLCGICL